jgi:hypothetical protein
MKRVTIGTLGRRFNRAPFWEWHPRTFTDWLQGATMAAPVVFVLFLIAVFVDGY